MRFRSSLSRRTTRSFAAVVATLALGLLGAGALASPAAAAPPADDWSCRATSLDIGTGPLPLDPILDPILGLLSTGSDDAACETSDGSPLGGALNQVTGALAPLGIELGALTTTTTTDASKPVDQRTPEAFAKVAGLKLSVLGLAPIVTVDAVESQVQAACVAGSPQYTSTYGVAGLSVFGQPIVLDGAVREISGGLAFLGAVVRLTPGAQNGDGERTALRIEVLSALGDPLLDVKVATARVDAGSGACLTASADAPQVDGRTISADVTPSTGGTVQSCSFAVTPPGGTATTVAGTYADGRCTATLPRDAFPPSEDDYAASTTVTDSNGRTATSPTVPFELAPPTAAPPTINGRVISTVVTPGAGATFADDACELTIAKAGESPTALTATLVTDPVSGVQRCEATLPSGEYPAGDYVVATKVTDSLGDSATSSGTVTTGGPTVGGVTLDGRDVSADLTATPDSPIASCAFRVTRQADGSTPAGATVTVPGTLNGDKTECTATLDRARFGAGTYDIVAVAVDEAGNSGEAAGAGTLAGPSVGAPELDGRDLTVGDVVPGTGATIDPDSGCSVTLTPVGGGAAIPVDATYDAAAKRCEATLPPDVAGGAYTVTTTVTDSNGDTAVGEGQVTVIGGPTVSTPAIDGRTVSATVQPSPGRTVASCSFTLTPAAGGTAKQVPGTLSGTTCSASLPEADFPTGEYAVIAAAVDDAGYRGTATGSGTVTGGGGEPQPHDATVGPPTIDGREVTAQVTSPGDSPITGCSLSVEPAGGGNAITVPGTFADGACKATLPREQFPPGGYVVDVTVTQQNGRTAGSSGPVTVAGPTVGTPVAAGPAIAVPVTPGPGATVTECTFTITPAGGGAAKTVPGVYDKAAAGCATILPAADFPSGAYDVVVTIKDSYGDTATGGARLTIQQTGVGSFQAETPGEVAQAFLACEGGTSALIDVRQSGSRARVAGVALEKLAGKRVDVQLYQPGKKRRTVGRTTVSKDGRFSILVTAPRNPPRATRYRAVVDGRASRTLRLVRRTLVSKTTVKNGRVTITGRITKPYPKVGLRISVQRRVDCTRYKNVSRTSVKRNGRFSFSFNGTKGQAYLYRVETRVPSRKGGPARARSFSLPQIVAIK